MAKAGFWLRGAKGKLAGATIYKGSTGTVMREIVKPRNPKTDRQMYQRAIMATIMRLYSLGSEIFDHSFEGKAVGFESMNYFRSVNLKRLRAILKGDSINNTMNGHVVAPGTNCAVPNAYIVSEGTYNQDFMTLNVLAQSANVTIPATGDIPTIGAYAAANHLVEGDIYTFLAILTNENKIVYQGDEGGGSSVFDSELLYVQFKVKAGALDDTTAIDNDTPITALFDIEGNLSAEALSSIGEAVFSDNFLVDTASLVSGAIGYTTGAVGVIRSHEDSGLRSNTILQYFGSDDLGGITYEHIIPEWKKAASSLGNSSLILEGVDYQNGNDGSTKLSVVGAKITKQDLEDYGKYVPCLNANENRRVLPFIERPDDDDCKVIGVFVGDTDQNDWLSWINEGTHNVVDIKADDESWSYQDIIDEMLLNADWEAIGQNLGESSGSAARMKLEDYYNTYGE